jgi:hypothetical protein
MMTRFDNPARYLSCLQVLTIRRKKPQSSKPNTAERSPSSEGKKSLTYLLIPWSRVLLEKLTGFQLLKKFPAFYGTRKFITAFISARHLSLS